VAKCARLKHESLIRVRIVTTMKGMRRTKRRGWAMLLVLGALFLRALVPAGFLLAPVNGSLAFVLCDAEMSGALQHQHHHHPGHDGSAHHDGGHGDPTCPYAQSAGPAPLPSLPALAGAEGCDLLLPPVALTQTLFSFGPPRQQSSRGPPSPA
jgi:hypothetical protein